MMDLSLFLVLTEYQNKSSQVTYFQEITAATNLLPDPE